MLIFIIGPTASGKTTIGQKLAKFLKINFIDIDHEIEKRSGADVSWIFDIEGEKGFRKRESDILIECCDLDNYVVSTGGGSILKRTNRDLISSSGIVIYLKTSIQEQMQRTTFDNSRPMIDANNREEIFLKMKEEREPLYEEIADFFIDQDSKSHVKIVKEIVSNIKRKLNESKKS